MAAEPIDTAAVRDAWDNRFVEGQVIHALCTEIDRLREALENSRELHARLLAHLRETQ